MGRRNYLIFKQLFELDKPTEPKKEQSAYQSCAGKLLIVVFKLQLKMTSLPSYLQQNCIAMF